VRSFDSLSWLFEKCSLESRGKVDGRTGDVNGLVRIRRGWLSVWGEELKDLGVRAEILRVRLDMTLRRSDVNRRDL
jgi:hypothetical protein